MAAVSIITLLPASLPVPAVAGGVSAAVDVTAASGPLTFTTNGNNGDVIVVQGSPDGVTLWGDVLNLSNGNASQTPADQVFGFIRLVRRVVDPTPGVVLVNPLVSMTAQPIPTGYAFITAAVPVPVGDGVGAAVNLQASDLTSEARKGSAKSIVCSAFDPGDNLTLENSADGNAPWATVMQLQPGRILAVSCTLGFVRIRRARVPAAGPRVGVDGATAAFMGLGFSGGAGSGVGSRVVLDFDGTVKNVSIPGFWQTGVNLAGTAFLYSALVRCRTGGYILSDGYGGAHAMLLGFSDFGGGRLTPSGNVLGQAGASTSYTFDDSIGKGRWAFIEIGWDGANLIGYIDGVPSCKIPFVGPRQSAPAFAGGGGDIYLGGSDHNNFDGSIAAVRTFEDSNPYLNPFPQMAHRVFYPFFAYWPASDFSSFSECHGLWDLTKGAMVIDDAAPRGHVDVSGIVRRHPGVLIGGQLGRGIFPAGAPHYSTASTPKYILDSQFPFINEGGPIVLPTSVGAAIPAAVPGSAKIFDSFGRADQVPAWDLDPSLGNTEGGSLGVKAWQTGAFENGATTAAWGILNGAAVFLDFNMRSIAWVNNNSATIDVRVDRRPGAAGVGYSAGVCFRVQDRQNFLYAMTYGGDPAGQVVRLGQYIAGVESNLDGAAGMTEFAAPAAWNTLRAVANGTTLDVYCDATHVGTYLGQARYQAQVGVGLYTPAAFGPTYVDGFLRLKNFTVF